MACLPIANTHCLIDFRWMGTKNSVGEHPKVGERLKSSKDRVNESIAPLIFNSSRDHGFTVARFLEALPSGHFTASSGKSPGLVWAIFHSC